MEMSWIQRHALSVLLRQESVRIKDMCPDDVAANLFSYHLAGLIGDKLIIKTSRGTYQLTDKGMKLAGAYSTATLRPTENIKTVVMFYAKHDGRTLLFRWSRQPYMNKVTLAYDRMALGTTLVDGVASALEEKLGAAAPVRFMTSSLVAIYRGDQQISHLHALVYEVDVSALALPHVSLNGEAFLAAHDDEPDIIDGVSAYIDRIATATEPFDAVWRYGGNGKR